MTRVFLFDIDNTLLYTGGAGGVAMNAAFRDLFGISNGFARIEFSGRTDLHILSAGLDEHNVPGDRAYHLDQFLARYYELLPHALRQCDGYLMPGFPQLLETLAAEADARLGLATGNFSQAAHIKLEYYGIDSFFSGGGFGEESLDRADVVRAAITEVAGRAARQDILVIGDTPHDITSALESDVVAVGVATGNYSVDQLRESGAHLAFENFADWQASAEALLASAL